MIFLLLLLCFRMISPSIRKRLICPSIALILRIFPILLGNGGHSAGSWTFTKNWSPLRVRCDPIFFSPTMNYMISASPFFRLRSREVFRLRSDVRQPLSVISATADKHPIILAERIKRNPVVFSGR